MQELIEDINKLIMLLRVKLDPFKLKITSFNHICSIDCLKYHDLIMNTSHQYEKYKFHFQDLKIELSEDINNLIDKISKSQYLEILDEKICYHRIVYDLVNRSVYDEYGNLNKSNFKNADNFIKKFNKLFNTIFKVNYSYNNSNFIINNFSKNPNPHSILHYVSLYCEFKQLSQNHIYYVFY